MSCLTTSATRRSRIVPAAVLIASAAASSHDVLLVPMTSVTRYTLMTLSSRRPPSRAPPPGPRFACTLEADLGHGALLRLGLSLAPWSGSVQDRCAAERDRAAQKVIALGSHAARVRARASPNWRRTRRTSAGALTRPAHAPLLAALARDVNDHTGDAALARPDG